MLFLEHGHKNVKKGVLNPKLTNYQPFWHRRCSVKTVCGFYKTIGMDKERYGVFLRIESKCGKTRTRITPNTDTFYAVDGKAEKTTM